MNHDRSFVTLKLKKKEAKRGCEKIVFSPVSGQRVRLKIRPGIKNGALLQVNQPESFKVRVKVRRHTALWITLGLLAGIFLIGAIADSAGKGKDGTVSQSAGTYTADYVPSNVPEQNEHIPEITQSVSEIQSRYVNEDGCVEQDKAEGLLEEMYQYTLSQQEAGVFSSVTKNRYSIDVVFSSGEKGVYMLPVKDMQSGNGTLRVIKISTMTKLFDSALSPVFSKAAETIAKKQDGYYFDESDDISGKDLRPEDLLNLGGAKVLLWDGHGSESCMATNIDYEAFIAVPELSDDMMNADIGYDISDGTVVLYPDFWTDHYGSRDFENAVVILGTCLNGTNGDFPNAFLSRGARCVYANSPEIMSGYCAAMVDSICKKLANGAATGEALNESASDLAIKALNGNGCEVILFGDPYYRLSDARLVLQEGEEVCVTGRIVPRAQDEAIPGVSDYCLYYQGGYDVADDMVDRLCTELYFPVGDTRQLTAHLGAQAEIYGTLTLQDGKPVFTSWRFNSFKPVPYYEGTNYWFFGELQDSDGEMVLKLDDIARFEGTEDGHGDMIDGDKLVFLNREKDLEKYIGQRISVFGTPLVFDCDDFVSFSYAGAFVLQSVSEPTPTPTPTPAPTAAPTPEPTPEPDLDGRYVGYWSADLIDADPAPIPDYEIHITEIGPDYMWFDFSIYRIASFGSSEAASVLGYQSDPTTVYFDALADEYYPVSGHLELNGDSITLIIDESEQPNVPAGLTKVLKRNDNVTHITR